ncbi:spermidine/putrescine ABC transporter permease [Azospirillum sp. TSH7]|jgi:spermidine/putrescine transport system permease protein|uniref:ABC transporter permease n=1 Tax=unclassified Azospirillum TaxID=2630922 RepID=UPI000D620246|nr:MULTISPECIES: ABC transporter permease [unclassified Azospirillum]PWC69577.1 spermidine/putrescine ABC transporter permease [Azospirillum sp. TSH7]PWC69871.1 spermidine/putrescine ABC transporter permease [Azospirillum sp. TSH20]QCG97818.1 ABC transporter permease [Azospirillum sp. TSA2s]
MTAARLRRLLTGAYLVLFFGYLFLPLGIMAAATFNSSRFPTVTPWMGFTLSWFQALWEDQRMWAALGTSLIVGAGVIALAVPLGLAAALLLDRLHSRAKTFLYALMVSPLLTPGVIVGISTLVFWREWFGVSGGLFLTVVAQSSFIAAYAMLLFSARLERFDPALEEAALDLGATHGQVFRRITLPYLMPAILSAALLAFLQSFENYNTTLFVRGLDTTLTVYIATKVRTGLTPAVNALSLVLIALTILGAMVYEILRRREARRQAGSAAALESA